MTDTADVQGGPGAASIDELAGVVEAVLLACDKPLTHVKIAEAVGIEADSAHDMVASVVNGLNEAYEASGRAFRIERVSGGYRVMTLPEFAGAVAAVRGMQPSSKLSRASIETLSSVAYKQPLTRAEVDAIRGVSSGEVLKGLLDRRLGAIVGRADTLGRPMLYGTTKRILEAFGLASVRDLPPVEDGFEQVLAARAVEPAGEADETEGGDTAIETPEDALEEAGAGTAEERTTDEA